MSLFTKSVAAANCFPDTMRTILSCVYGDQTSPRLKQQGMEFAVWVFKHAETVHLTAIGPSILQKLLDTLDTVGAATDMQSMTLKGFAYQATGAQKSNFELQRS